MADHSWEVGSDQDGISGDGPDSGGYGPLQKLASVDRLMDGKKRQATQWTRGVKSRILCGLRRSFALQDSRGRLSLHDPSKAELRLQFDAAINGVARREGTSLQRVRNVEEPRA